MAVNSKGDLKVHVYLYRCLNFLLNYDEIHLAIEKNLKLYKRLGVHVEIINIRL